MDDVARTKPRPAFGWPFLLVLALPGCAALEFGCPAGLHPMPTAQLVFGRNIATSEGVSDADWSRFLDEEVTPRFPDGLTVLDAQGQWRGPDGALVRERSKVLFLILSGNHQEEDKLDEIGDAYKARFSQDSVLILRRTECAGF